MHWLPASLSAFLACRAACLTVWLRLALARLLLLPSNSYSFSLQLSHSAHVISLEISVSLAPLLLISPVFVPRFIPLATGYPPSFFLVLSYPPLSSPRFRPLSLPPRRPSPYVSLSLSLASLHDLSRLYLSPRPRHPSIGRPWASHSLFLYLSLSPSTPTRYRSTVSVPFPRCRDLSRLFLSFPYQSCSKQSPVRLCSVSWTHLSSSTPTRPTNAPPTASTSPLLRARSDLGSLPRSSTHTPRTPTPLFFLFPISLFSRGASARTLSSDYRSSLSADVCRLDDCHALPFNPRRRSVFSGEYSQNSNVLIFSVPPLFSFFIEGYALIRRHLNPLATRCRRYMCYVEKSFSRFE